MNNDLISRKALQEAFTNECIGECGICEHIRHNPEGCALIDDAPAVDAEPVRHGRWNKPAYAAQDWIWRCSACKGCTEFIAANVFYKYCPWCGAKMDGGA